jgi:uncharacterized protein YraI
MSVLIGHASIDENGKASGGKAGNQTKKELCTRNWYKKPWSVLLRPKDAIMAEKIAIACEQACANQNIGYDQGQRNTLYTQAKAVNFDLSKITTPCECDCSSLACICAIAAGAPADKLYIGGNMGTTRTMRSYFRSTGMFEILTDSKYLTISDYLKRGDIVVNEGSHTFIVLSNGSKVAGDQPLMTPTSSDVIGIAVALGSINVRTGPSTGYKAIGIVRKNEQVQVFEKLSNGWLRIMWNGAEAFVSNSGNKYFNFNSVSHTTSSEKVTASYRVKITASTLRIRTGPGTKYSEKGFIRNGKIVGIVEEQLDSQGKKWGLLDEFATTRDAWISLSYTEKY